MDNFFDHYGWLLTALGGVGAVVLALLFGRKKTSTKPVVPPLPAPPDTTQADKVDQARDKLEAERKRIEQEQRTEQEKLLDKQRDEAPPMLDDDKKLNDFLKDQDRKARGDG